MNVCSGWGGASAAFVRRFTQALTDPAYGTHSCGINYVARRVITRPWQPSSWRVPFSSLKQVPPCFQFVQTVQLLPYRLRVTDFIGDSTYR